MSDVANLMRDPAVATALAWVDASTGKVIEEAVRVCEIPSPTGLCTSDATPRVRGSR